MGPALLLAAIFIIILLSSAMGCLWQPIEPYVKSCEIWYIG